MLTSVAVCVCFAGHRRNLHDKTQVGLVCTDTHLLMLGVLNPKTDQSSASDSDDSDVDDDVTGNDDTKEISGDSTRQLRIFLRIRKRYNTVATPEDLSLLMCARGGTLDLFKVRSKQFIRCITGPPDSREKMKK